MCVIGKFHKQHHEYTGSIGFAAEVAHFETHIIVFAFLSCIFVTYAVCLLC